MTYNVIGEKAMEAFKPFVKTENYYDDKTTEISKVDFDKIAKLIEEHQGVLRTIEAEKKAKNEERIAQEEKRKADIFAKAKATGQKQELSSSFIMGDDIPKRFRDDDSDMGHMVTWAMPDGTTKTEFIHSY